MENSRNNNQRGRQSGFNHTRGGHFQTAAAAHRGIFLIRKYEIQFFFFLGTAIKRPFSATIPPNKRFRTDLNNSFPGANRGPGPMRNYETEQYNYNRPVSYNNGNNQWSNRYPNDQQQRQQVFERSNFELRSLVSDNNEYYGGGPSYLMSGGNNYNQNRQANFNGNGGRGYNNQQSNYDPNFIHPGAQVCFLTIVCRFRSFELYFRLELIIIQNKIRHHYLVFLIVPIIELIQVQSMNLCIIFLITFHIRSNSNEHQYHQWVQYIIKIKIHLVVSGLIIIIIPIQTFFHLLSINNPIKWEQIIHLYILMLIIDHHLVYRVIILIHLCIHH